MTDEVIGGNARIELLSPRLANQIAAGEVVDDPAAPEAPMHHHLGVSAFATHAVVHTRSVVPVDDDVPPCDDGGEPLLGSYTPNLASDKKLYHLQAKVGHYDQTRVAEIAEQHM